jgi:hypothetical protein
MDRVTSDCYPDAGVPKIHSGTLRNPLGVPMRRRSGRPTKVLAARHMWPFPA